MIKHRILSSLVVAILMLSMLAVLAPSVWAASEEIGETQATYIRQNTPTATYSGNYFHIWDKSASAHRGLIRFDLSSIPAGTAITSATLEMYYQDKMGSADPVGKTLMVYKVTRTDWVEGQATWNVYKTGSSWTTAGGDYVTSSPAGAGSVVPGSFGWMEWDVLDLVNDAFGDTDSLELLIRFQTEGVSGTDSLAELVCTGANAPKLTIVYSSLPTIETDPATLVTFTTARLHSDVVDGGESSVVVRFGWGETSESDILDYDHYYQLPSTYAVGATPYLDVTGLTSDTLHYFRAEATNFVKYFDEDTYSTVATGLTSSLYSDWQFRGKVQYAGGRYWVWYFDGEDSLPPTDWYFKTSADDGATWSAATACLGGSIWLDGGYFHQAYVSGTDIYYRRGTWAADGTIAWGASHDTGVNGRARSADITIDSDGYPWVTYRDTGEYVAAMKSSVKDGTWTTASGHPTRLSADSNAGYYGSIEPMLDGKVAVLWGKCITPVKCKVWDGTSWGSEEVAIDEAVGDQRDFDTLSYGDTVYAAGYAANGIWVNIRDEDGTWGTEEHVYYAGGGTTLPALSLDTEWDILYCFWNRVDTAPNIYFKARVNGVWDTDPVLWKDETTDGMGNSQSNIMAIRYAVDNFVAVAYGTETADASPYKVKFAGTYGAGASDLGDELTFSTINIGDGVVLNFKGLPYDDGISLWWDTLLGVENYLVRYSLDDYPATTSDGFLVYFDEGSSVAHEGLIPGRTYYYSLWGESGGDYTDTRTALIMTSSAYAGAGDTLEAPDEPTNWMAAPDYVRMEGLGYFYDGMNGAADVLDVPRETMWFVMYLSMAIFLTLLFYLKVRESRSGTGTLTIAVLTLLLFGGLILGLLPFWVPLITTIILVGTAISHREVAHS